MPRTTRITYGQCLVLGSPRPANQSNIDNLTGMKRVQAVKTDFTFARERFKQIGSADYIGDVNLTNPQITLGMDYYYSNGTNEVLLGLNVDGAKGGALKGLRRPNQDNNFYLLIGSGLKDEVLLTSEDADFKDNFNVMGLGNCFLNSYSIGGSVGSVVAVSASVQADNMEMRAYSDSTNGELIPAIDSATQKPSTANKYKIKKAFFQNTTNQDGLIDSALAPSGIKITLPSDVNVPGLEFTGDGGSAFINSFGLEFSVDRSALYGFGSIYPYGRRAVLPVLGSLSFGAVASEFQSGTLSELVRLDENNERSYNFEIALLGEGGNTGLQIEVEGARMDAEGFSQSIGDFGSIEASLSFSMSDSSGLRVSTPPLILNQPTTADTHPATLSVEATGRTSADTSVYSADGFKYQWYSLDPLASVGANQGSYTTTATGSYYVVVFNELGQAKSNTSSVT
jgi:hypothetical protein